MHRLFRRSILWLLPVMMLPIAALGVMQYRFLREMERKSVSAERNSLRNSLERATDDVERRMRRSAAAALTVSDRQARDVALIGAHFAAHPVPAARTFFLMRFQGGMYEIGWFNRTGVEKWPAKGEAEAVKMATVSWHVAHKWDRLVPQPALQVDDRDPGNLVVMRPVVDEAMHVVGVAGVVLDQGLARRRIAAMAAEALKKSHPDKDVNVRVSETFPRDPRGRDYITQSLSFPFADLRIGIRDACASPEELAAYNFRTNAMWTGGAFVVLLSAVALAIGALARQMRLSQMKSDFVSNVSHELRTPLSSIRVFGEYMRLGRVTSGEKIREYGEYIEAESRRLTQLINNILDFSKIESAEKKYRFCETDVRALVEQAVAGFEMPLREKGVAISFRAEGLLPPRLPVDRDAMAQVLMNLLDNAVKYSGDRKEIEVAVRGTADEVRISVRDRGIGIPPAEQKKIFEKFYRVGSGLVHDVKGSGLGLSIVEHVVRAHGGRVELESQVGEGSTFTLVLPVRGEFTEEPVRVDAAGRSVVDDLPKA